MAKKYQSRKAMVNALSRKFPDRSISIEHHCNNYRNDRNSYYFLYLATWTDEKNNFHTSVCIDNLTWVALQNKVAELLK